MKPITTPINRALRGIFSDRLKAARTRRAPGNRDFPVNLWRGGKKKQKRVVFFFSFSLDADHFPAQI